jgi:starch synthase
MHVAHLLRKYDPNEWGGTETHLKQLVDRLEQQGVTTRTLAPTPPTPTEGSSLIRSPITPFKAYLPFLGISRKEREKLWSIGGNLISFDLMRLLWREPNLSLIHSHTGGRLGAAALQVARLRKVPLVLSIHGGLLDMPLQLKEHLQKPAGWDIGKPFGYFTQARYLPELADALITVNPKEAKLLQERYPGKEILYQPHGVSVEAYQATHSQEAKRLFPQIKGRPLLLILGRIDPIKNQLWVIQQLPRLLQKHPRLLCLFVGPVTHEGYNQELRSWIEQKGLSNHCLFTGVLATESPALIGLLQASTLMVLPSVSEPFGLVILESWAAGTPVLASRTTGTTHLIEEGKTGLLFDLESPGEFIKKADSLLTNSQQSQRITEHGLNQVQKLYNSATVGRKFEELYRRLCQ